MFFTSLKNKSTLLTWILWCIAIVVIGLFIAGYASFSGAFDKHYTREETIQNFNERGDAIIDLADYFKQQKPINHEVFFEPDGNRYSIHIGLPNWAVLEKAPNKTGSDLKINAAELDTLLTILGWTKETIITLKQKLEKANCLSIQSNDDAVSIEFRTGTWSAYSYIVYDKPLSDSLLQAYKDAGITILKNRVKLAHAAAL